MTGEVNMNHDIRIGQNRHRSPLISLGSALTILVILTYLIQVFNIIIKSYAPYRLILTMALLMLLVAKRRISLTRGDLIISSSWMPMLIIVAAHLLLGGFKTSYLMDWYTYFIGYVFIALLGDDEIVLRSSFKVIHFFGFFYAFSIWIQLLFPAIYNIVWLGFLPVETVSRIQQLSTVNGLLTGFSSNPGFTAGHIVTGIMVAFSRHQALQSQERKLTLKDRLSTIFLVSSLIMIGKRGHLLALIFAAVLTYLIYNKGRKRLVAINVLLVFVVILVPILFFFGDWIANIPGLERISGSVVGLINGDDVSSGRSKLFALALQHFRGNPIFGIGWSNFRASVVGTVTIITELDTHNIYLQLLCETGIVGLVSVAIPMIVFLVQGIKNVSIINYKWPQNFFLRCVGLYSLGYQLFFLVYGFSGNPLYDYNYAIMYFVSCAITALVYRKSRKEHITT